LRGDSSWWVGEGSLGADDESRAGKSAVCGGTWNADVLGEMAEYLVKLQGDGAAAEVVAEFKHGMRRSAWGRHR